MRRLQGGGGKYYLACSGGKDSVTLLRLAQMAEVPFEAHYNVTTVDPPELTHFLRDQYPEVIFDKPKYSMRQLIIQRKFPPTRICRYCCKYLKESYGKGFVTLTGVRWAESNNRKKNHGVVTAYGKKAIKAANKSGAENVSPNDRNIVLNDDNDESRRAVELCYRTNKTLVNPIIDWTDEDVWQFIRSESVPYCPLYDEGWKRIGCVGCPMGTLQEKERGFKRWPFFYKMYVHAFDAMLVSRKNAELETQWQSGEEVMDWWLHGDK